MNVNQKFDMQMQTLSSEFRDKFYEAQQEEWNKLPFTSTAINEKFPRYREFAMMYETRVGLNISPEYSMHLMHGNIESYFVSDIVTLCQAMERRTYFEFGMATGGFKPETAQGFADFLAVSEQLTNEINTIVEPIKDRLVKKMQTLQALQMKNGNRKI